MPVKLPPPKQKTKGPGGAYDAYIAAHPTMAPYKDMIWKWSHRYGLDATYFAAMLWTESFAEAKRRGVSPETIMSPTGAGVGIGQINPIHVGEYVSWLGRKLTRADLKNPGINVHWSADYFAQGKAKFGTYDATYKNWYNPGYTGNAFATVPKGYAPTSSGYTPTENAGNDAEGTGAKTALNDKWAVLGKDGRVKFVSISDPNTPPKNVLKYGSSPLTQSSFISVWRQTYSDTFFAYTGRQASGKEIAGILKNAPSVYTLANSLAAGKDFVKSPTYKAHAPGIIQYASNIIGSKPDNALVRKAIAENWDQATLYAHLKNSPAYQNGPEFKDNAAKMGNVFQTIYGHTPDDANTQALVKKVTMQGWTPDEFAAWLRDPKVNHAYLQSPEYRTKALAFAQAMGLVTGSMGATLSEADVNATLHPTISNIDGTNPDEPPAGKVAPPATGYPPATPPLRVGLRPDNRSGPRRV